MKHLRETFTDQEFALLQAKKEQRGLNWHDFIMTLGIDFIIRKTEQGNYEAVDSSTGRILFGGDYNIGGVDGSDATAVIQAALNSTLEEVKTT